jgi:hypothetical protein
MNDRAFPGTRRQACGTGTPAQTSSVSVGDLIIGLADRPVTAIAHSHCLVLAAAADASSPILASSP